MSSVWRVLWVTGEGGDTALGEALSAAAAEAGIDLRACPGTGQAVEAVAGLRPHCVVLDAIAGACAEPLRRRFPLLPLLQPVSPGLSVPEVHVAGMHRVDVGSLSGAGLEAAVAAAVRAAGMPAAGTERARHDGAFLVPVASASRVERESRVFQQGLVQELDEALGTIQSFLQMLQRERSSGPVREYLDVVSAAVADVARLSRRVREHAAAAATPDRPARLAPGAVRGLVDAVLEELSPRAVAAQAVVAVGPLPPVQCDARSLSLLLSHLLENALAHAGGDGPLRLRVGGRITAAGSELWVEDDGVGLTPAQARRIFEPFVRFAGSQVAGSGLGLTICRQLVKGRGGRIHCEPVPGGGTRFVVGLPLRHCETAPAAALEAPASEEGPLRLAIIAGETQTRLAREALSDWLPERLQVSSYGEGVEALRALAGTAATRPDLILLEAGPDGGDGLAVLEGLKSDPRLCAVPVVLCTSAQAGLPADLRRGVLGTVRAPVSRGKLRPYLAATLH